jgi:hypothetical protein
MLILHFINHSTGEIMDLRLESAKTYNGMCFNHIKPMKAAYQCKTVAFIDGIEFCWLSYRRFVEDYDDAITGLLIFAAENGFQGIKRINVVRSYYTDTHPQNIHFLSIDLDIKPLGD